VDFIQFKYVGCYTGLRQPQLTNLFTCHVPANVVAMPTNPLCEELSQKMYILFDISWMNRRILIPYNK